MQKNQNILTLAYTLFVIIVFLSAMLPGILSEIVYYFSFIIPIGLSLFLTRKDKVEGGKFLSINKEGVKRFLPLIFPAISVIIVISVITSMIISSVSGKTNNTDIGDSLIPALINHALLPALFEEALCRYIPMRLFAHYSPRGTILLSAFFFSFMHADLFAIPYAFFAGMVFMAIDLACDSVIPSVVIHFINNALSVVMIIYSDNPVISTGAIISLIVLTLISVCFIVDYRRDYESALNTVTEKGERVTLSSGMIFFVALTLAIAIIRLL